MPMELQDNFVNYEILLEAECVHIRKFHPNMPVPSLEEYLQKYQGSPAKGFVIDSQCVGGIFVKDQTVHIGLKPEYHGMWSLLWPACCRWMFTISDPLYALLMPSNQRVVALVRSIGGRFVKNVKVPHVGSMMVYELRNSTTPYHLSAFERRKARRSTLPQSECVT
jgi:hypothetical protein